MWTKKINDIIEYQYEAPMSLSDCITICLDIWEQLAASGAEFKPSTNLLNDCAACQYARGHNPYDMCSCCPFEWSINPKEGATQGRPSACLYLNSLYDEWSVSNTESENRYWARRIVERVKGIDK